MCHYRFFLMFGLTFLLHGGLACAQSSNSAQDSSLAEDNSSEPSEMTARLTMTFQSTESQASLRGLSVVDSLVVWASGSGGEVLRTVDGGQTWSSVKIKEAIDLDFRDIHAFDANHAIVLSAGSPGRVYHTTDGGKVWKLAYENTDERIFFDAMEFWDVQRGIAFSDPIEGKLVLIQTEDGGQSWTALKNGPNTLEGEAGFAASGSCLAIRPGGRVWVGLGGAHSEKSDRPAARILSSSDFGSTWTAVNTPLIASQGGGVFSLAMATDSIGVAVGGNYLEPDFAEHHVAVTSDGGKTWREPSGALPSKSESSGHKAPRCGLRGYRSTVAVLHFGAHRMFVAAGTNGCDYSIDDGESWQAMSEDGLNAISFASGLGEGLAGGSAVGWGCGGEGRVAVFQIEDLTSQANP